MTKIGKTYNTKSLRGFGAAGTGGYIKWTHHFGKQFSDFLQD